MIRRRDFLTGSAAALMYGAGHKELASVWTPKSARPVTYDERSVITDGRRALLTCGEIHYPRSTRAMWPTLLQRSKELGLNTITSYVFWNVHEMGRGKYDFSGERDLGYFLAPGMEGPTSDAIPCTCKLRPTIFPPRSTSMGV